jgi:hypothetical protein
MFAPSFSRMWRVRALLVWGQKGHGGLFWRYLYGGMGRTYGLLYVTVSKIISAPSGDP